jgi:hypothetical protein
MNTSSPEDPRFRALVRDARPAPDLPPGFQNAVWRRLEKADTKPASPFGRLDELVVWLLRPRHALVGATVLVLVGISIGIVQSGSLARDLARDRYVASVNPLASR